MSSLSDSKAASSAAEQYRQGYLPPAEQQALDNTSGRMGDMPARQEDVYLPSEWNPKEKGGVEMYKAAGKLKGKNAVITGGDSGIGRSTAVLFAMEGASNIVLHYVPEREESDARETAALVEKAGSAHGTRAHLIAADLRGGEAAVGDLARDILDKLGGRVDVLFNNAGFQREVEDLAQLPYDQLQQTFQVNIISLMALTGKLLDAMPRGSAIINNASINHYIGHPKLLDYSATKGAIVAFTRALSNQVVGARSIRVNAVAPGPVVAPLPPATMGKDSLESFGTSTPMKRPGQPVEIAAAVVYLACVDSSYMSGQTLHLNGGVVVGS